MSERSTLFSIQQPGGNFVVVDIEDHPGNVFFVDSGNTDRGGDTAGFGKDPDNPFLTTDFAIGQTTANQGDVIYLMPGHTDSLVAAGTITADVAGISVIGLGEGADRPTLTFSALTSASFLISAASFKLKNVIGVAAIDALANPFHVQAADCELDIEWQDGSAAIEAARAVLTTAAAERLKLKLRYEGFIAGNATVNAVRLVGVDGAEIIIDFYGVASTAIVEFHTTACHNIAVVGGFYNSGTTDGSKAVVDTVTGSTWGARFWDVAAGASFSGSSGSALASDDVSGLSAQITTMQAEISGAAGIVTWLAAAAPANAVSLAEAIRYLVEQQSLRPVEKAYTFSGDGGTQGAKTLFTVTGDVELEIFGICKDAFTSGGAATIEVGVSGNTAALIAQSTATELIANEIWHDNSPTTTLESLSSITTRTFVISNGQDIDLLIGAFDLTAGDCTFYCRWRALSSDGNVVAA